MNMISKIDHIVIFVTNMDNAIDFYTKTLGFSIGYTSPEYTSVLTQGETSIGLHIADEVAGAKTGKATTQISFLVDDIENAYNQLKDKVEVLKEIDEIAPGKFMFNFVDLDDNQLSCYEIRE